MKPQLKNRIRCESGQTMTEFAIVLPLLCVLLFGIIQFGIVWNQYVTVTDAARAGARKAAVSRHTNPDDGCTTARYSAHDLAIACSVSVSGSLDRPGADVTVRVSYPYSIKLLDWTVKSGFLVSETTERME